MIPGGGIFHMRKKGLFLSEKEKKLLKKRFSQLKTRSTGYLRNRIRAILMIGEEKKKQKEVAKKCKVGIRALNHWLTRYRLEGLKGLKDKPRPGKASKITKEQKEELKKIIADGPIASGYDSGIWTCRMVSDIISKKFKVNYSLCQISRILHKLGFSYQTPKKNSQGQILENKKNGWRRSYQK